MDSEIQVGSLAIQFTEKRLKTKVPGLLFTLFVCLFVCWQDGGEGGGDLLVFNIL